MPSTKEEQIKKFYHLIAGKVIFSIDGSEEFGVSEINAIINTSKNCIAMQDIRKAHQGLQINLANKMGEPVDTKDIIILAICPLGHMTEAEFMAVPKGFEVKEKIGNDIQAGIHAMTGTKQ